MTLRYCFDRLFWVVPRRKIRIFHWSVNVYGHVEISCYSDEDYFYLRVYFKRNHRISGGILFPRNLEMPDFPDKKYNTANPILAFEIYSEIRMKEEIEALKSLGYYGVGFDSNICLR